MSAAAFIAGDWGTSNLRLFLCDGEGRAIESASGPGASQSRGRFAGVFDELTAAWRSRHGSLQAVLCGMAGSSFGWAEAPYLLCPEDIDSVAGSTIQPRGDVHIVPGLKCVNPLGGPDVLRGEETQVLGALALEPGLARGRHLLCLPGTHTKWLSLHDGVVIEFLTVPTGELFGLLCDHSVLVRDASTPLVHRAPEFEFGLEEAVKHRSVSVLHRLFQSRSLRIAEELSPEGAASWTSGLLIGTDVGGALPLFESLAADATVHVIGAPSVAGLYATALARFEHHAEIIEGDAAALAGLAAVHSALVAA
jgi:2-dehydro-3-deoxygalactonokinase